MSLTGYRPSAVIELTHPALVELVRATANAPAVCFGFVEAPGADSQPPYITQVVASAGQLVAVHRKAGLGEGEDADFGPGTPSGRCQLAGVPLSIAVCAEIGSEPPYEIDSAVVLGPSAPGLYGDRRRTDADWRRGFDWWRGSVIADANRLLRAGQWLAVSTQAGATDDEDFPGWAALVGRGGEVLDELPDWREGVLVVDLPGRASLV